MSSQKLNDMIKGKRTFFVNAQGNSMHPLLQNGDKIEYLHVPPKKIELNDVVLVYAGEVLLTHRVIYRTVTEYITRGDNNISADPPIQKGQVLAKATRFMRKKKWYGMQDLYLTQSALYLREIQRVKTAFNDKKISHVFLKGVLISLRYEGVIPKRIYADCDILVQREDYGAIEMALGALGYTLQKHTLFDEKKSPENQPEISYIKIVNGTPVVFDVHFEPVFLMTQLGGMSLLYPPTLLKQLGDSILNHRVVKNIRGSTYALCCVSDQILYLALHIFHHNYTDIIRYQLLDSVIRKSVTTEIWSDLATTINQYQLQGYIYPVFTLLKKYCKTSIPRSFFRSIESSPFNKRVQDIFLKRVDIFSSDSRFKAGIERFMLVFLLSPEPIWKKSLLIIHPDMLRAVNKILFTMITSRFSQVKRRFIQ